MSNKYWRVAPTCLGDLRFADGVALAAPRDLITKLRNNDGIVVAGWDYERSEGRVEALGIVRSVDKSRALAIVDWRKAVFTLFPSPQGRTQWLSREFFVFADAPAERYRLSDRFHERFAAESGPTGDSEAVADTPVNGGPATAPVRLGPAHKQETSSGPQRNRVTPSGEIIATTARGTLMGNRADANRWLICDPDFERELKAPRKYTKLFFLDEAVALGAGHRPCRTCRRTRYDAYLSALERDYGIGGAPELDRLLSAARRATRQYEPLASLPDGAFVAFGDDDDYRLVWDGALHRWTPHGYRESAVVDAARGVTAMVLTPAPTLAALRRGYRVAVHPSVGQER